MDKDNFKQLLGAFGLFWVAMLCMAAMAFYAGRCTMVPQLDIRPVIQVDVPEVKPIVDVHVPKQEPPVVNVTVPELKPTPVLVENKLNIPEPVPPVVNVVVSEKGDVKTIKPTESTKPTPRAEVKIPETEERDPDGKLLPPPKKENL